MLAWLSILAHKNKDVPAGGKLITVRDVAMEHWETYGRNFFARYDYEGVESEKAEAMMEHLRGVMGGLNTGDKLGDFEVALADDFSYTDPVDGSVAAKQGLRFVFADGSRIVFRCAPLHSRTLLLGACNDRTRTRGRGGHALRMYNSAAVKNGTLRRRTVGTRQMTRQRG